MRVGGAHWSMLPARAVTGLGEGHDCTRLDSLEEPNTHLINLAMSYLAFT